MTEFLRIIKNILKPVIFIFLDFFYFLLSHFQKLSQDITKAKVIIFTHNLGGGTSLYTKNSIDKENVLLIYNKVRSMSHNYFVLENTITNKKKIIHKQQIELLLNTSLVEKIVINSLSSYFDPFYILDKIINEKNKSNNIKIRIMVHDFNVICPSIHLVVRSKFCNFQCEKLCNNTCPSIYPTKQKDVFLWREKWHKILSCSSEIRCFSKSSKNIIKKIYPFLDENLYTVIPHDMEYFQQQKIISLDQTEMRVGIIGNTDSDSKGGSIVKSFIEYSEQKNYLVFLLGITSIKNKNKNTSIVGKYDNSKLRQIIIGKKINVVFFPSICPETFSYLVSELIILNLPVVCFNIGAQAEKIKQYDKGVICYNYDNQSILTALEACWKK